MYVPTFNAVDDDAEIRAFVAEVGAAELITTGADGYPLVTLMPVLWDADVLTFHLARANPHWREIAPASPATVVVTGPQTYVSPTWYATKAEHGRVVPTWNYSAVEIRGRATVHTDPAWLRDAVTRLTDAHEGRREQPWAVTDAPERYVAGQLKGIVGVEVVVERVEAKAKLSQNRSAADRAGVVAGLRDRGSGDGERVAATMEAQLSREP